MKKSDQLISVSDAAKLMSVTPQRIRDYINGGRLPAQKVGRAFVVRRGDAEKFKPREPGRPTKE